MAENSKIQWTHNTFNPWIGCSKVSEGCRFCYAEELMDHRRHRVEWGPNGDRSKTASSTWGEPLRWNRAAKQEGVRYRVFCASLADVFEDRDDLHLWREELFELIRQCSSLDWLLLTKRPENISKWIPWQNEKPWDHVWLGTSIENQSTADERIPYLLNVPAVCHFLSIEPLLGPINFRTIPTFEDGQAFFRDALNKYDWHPNWEMNESWSGSGIDWVIVGGESGSKARPCNVEWIRDIVDQCRAAGVAPFVKQLGANVEASDVIDAADQFPCPVGVSLAPRPNARVHLKHPKGGDPDEWPEDLRVRELPKVSP